MKFKIGDEIKTVVESINGFDNMKNKKGKIIDYLEYGNAYVIILECSTRHFFCNEDMIELVAENNAETVENTDEVAKNTDESIDQSIDKFEKEDFKFGDIVTLRNGIQGLITIEEVQYNDDTFNHRNDFNDDLTHISNDKNLDIMRVQRYVNEVGFDTYQLKTLYYRKEEILTEKEKEYLSRFIKPFRNRIREISKMNYKNEEWLLFILNRENGIENFSLPSFDKNTIYKGMETDKEYTLEELGL